MNQNKIESMSSINSISTNESIIFHSENDIDIKAFKSLNSELDDLGYEPINSFGKCEMNKLVKFSLDLVYRYRRQSVTIERLQEQ